MINVIEIELKGIAAGLWIFPPFGSPPLAPSNSERKLFINATHIRGGCCQIDEAGLCRHAEKSISECLHPEKVQSDWFFLTRTHSDIN